MQKLAPILILLTTVVLPFIAWGGTMLVNHESRISRNETIHERLNRIESKLDRNYKAFNDMSNRRKK